MLVSAIVPVYNTAAHAQATLRCLAGQELPSGISLETIVVDDGSDEVTQESLSKFPELCPNVRVVRRPRDHLSCRSLARNLGLQTATGELALFVDAGVLFEPDFVARALRHHSEPRGETSADPLRMAAQETLVLYRVLGLSAHESHEQQYLTLHPKHLPHALQALARESEWSDPREPIARAVGGDLDRLHAPWLFAWTALMSVPRSLALAVGGFDVDFLGWGSEDTDFGCSLFQAGTRFRFAMDEIALHVPHPRQGNTQSDSNRQNRRRLHEKHFSLATELYLLLTGVECNAFLTRLAHLYLPYAVSDWDWRWVEGILGASPSLRPSVLVGCRDERMRHLVAPSRMLDPCDGSRWAGAGALHLLGCHTPFETGELEVAIVWDASRLLPPCLLRAQLAEMARVARRVVCLFSTVEHANFSRYRDIDGWGWQSTDYVRQSLSSLGMEVVELGRGSCMEAFTATRKSVS
jgi:glycosyltransferase involved in cell wall biosynthesis